ncbi:hypothetical protein [Geotalea uraniireducens]|uniref:hypothetical protein n=1 Tax=Geotalea uraniireducens TaxID=351604 RepID=UPI00249162B2|nr:hypothetical protein [Geotalea uraniireducens]
MREKILGILLLLFMLCFVALIVEETFFGGRKRRQLEKQARNANLDDSGDNRCA